MLANSSDNPATSLKAVQAAVRRGEVRWDGRLLMLALNFLPLAHLLFLAGFLFTPSASWPVRIALALAGLYLLPPLLARLLLLAVPIPPGRVAVGGKAFFAWWAMFQLQVIFCRLPFLEEGMRLVPGLYSQWLRLWGSRIGRFTYWSPGVAITDRSFLNIGDDVVFGAGVRLNAHVLDQAADGRMELLLAPLKIGDRVLVGGYSLVTAGTEIAPGEVTKACQLLPPFSLWKDGKRIKSSPELE